MALKLGRWLGTLTPQRLAEILARRPDALAAPAPATIAELAERLASRPSVITAFQRLPQPAVQFIEVMQAAGGPAVSRAEVAASLGRTPDDPDLAAIIEVLSLRALVWPDGDALQMTAPLWSYFAYPLRLGPPARRLFAARGIDELRRVAHALGVVGARTKPQLIEALVAALSDGERVRALLATAPAEVAELMAQVAHQGPMVRSSKIIYGYVHCDDPALDWALSRGLLVADGWQAAVMPAEVGRALRGPDWHAPFHPHPPTPVVVPTDAEAVAREAVAAAGPALAGVAALLESCAATPIALLKAGGVGVREQRRLARALGTGEPTIRLWLELAHEAGLAAVDGEVVLPTEAYDEWRTATPAEQLAPLLAAWWRLPATPLAEHQPGTEPVPAALQRTGYADLVVELRRELLRAALDLPPAKGVISADALVPVVQWRAPLLVAALDSADELLTSMWREAALLGVVAHGALTPLGQALVAGADPAPVAATLLPPPVTTALFQTDLTAVVPGTPNIELAVLLDATADRESRGGAVIWRFSPASVRRALDAGFLPNELTARLRAVSAGELPQPLAYLIADVARRHGEVRVRSVACVLHAEDHALLTEIAAARALAPLGLTRLAPTVLASQWPLAETLAALRAAGYAPAAESADGSVIIERPSRRRAARRPELSRRSAPVRPLVADADPYELAAALLSAPNPLEAKQPAHADSPARTGQAPAGSPADAALAGSLAEADLAPARSPAEANLAPARSPAEANLARAGSPAGGDPVPADAADSAADRATAAISRFAPQLSKAEQRMLSDAVEHGTRVKIFYVNAAGNPSTRVIEPLAISGRVIEAWCHLRDEERVFSLARIESVTPA